MDQSTDVKRSRSRPDPGENPFDEEAHRVVATQAGVKKAEALQNAKVWGKHSTVLLFAGIVLISYTYSLDGVTTWQYQAITTSAFGQHSLLGAVATVGAIILAVAKPITAKIADLLGRGEAWIIAIALYVIGYIVLAACQSVESYAAGWWIRTCGYAGVQILIQIIIGDVTTLRYRTFVSALTSAPYFVNAFVGSNIGGGIIGSGGWRWGYGMFAIILPACALPIIGILLWSQRKAKKLGIVHSTNPYEEVQMREDVAKVPVLRQVIMAAKEVDIVGLLLFTAGWTCLLLPLTLANGGTLAWSNYKIIVLLVFGPLILIGLAFYEGLIARFPFIPARFLRNPTVLAAALIGFFDFISFYLQFTYQYSFIFIVKSDWSYTDQNYFSQTQTLSLTFAAIAAGAIIIYIRRYKWMLMFGLLLRLFAVGLMIHSKGANGSTAELVIVQLLQGLGGGIAGVVPQTAAQASVPHQDLASVTAVVLLFAEIGGAIGTAIAAAIWRHVMPGQLNERLTGLAGINQTTIDGIYGAITTAVVYPDGSPIRAGIVGAYDYTMKIILIVATIVAIVPPVLVFMMKDIRLDERQNAVENKGTDGLSITDSESEYDMKK